MLVCTHSVGGNPDTAVLPGVDLDFRSGARPFRQRVARVAVLNPRGDKTLRMELKSQKVRGKSGEESQGTPTLPDASGETLVDTDASGHPLCLTLLVEPRILVVFRRMGGILPPTVTRSQGSAPPRSTLGSFWSLFGRNPARQSPGCRVVADSSHGRAGFRRKGDLL